MERYIGVLSSIASTSVFVSSARFCSRLQPCSLNAVSFSSRLACCNWSLSSDAFARGGERAR
jgi:hypothetical protein